MFWKFSPNARYVTFITGVVSTCFFSALHAETPSSSFLSKEVHSDEEAFLIRRIAEFWKDGDYHIVKTQILDFFHRYPNSELKDYFLGILGDLYIQEGNFQEALSTYQQIQKTEVKNKIILNKLQCYYELNQFDHIVEEGASYANFSSKEFEDRNQEYTFLMAEGFFRQGLQNGNFEKKSDLYKQAMGLYEKLLETPYGEHALFALAEINTSLNNSEKAAELYATLSQKYPAKKEELLFQAATMQSRFDPNRAKELFKEIADAKGEKAHEAMLNYVILLYKTDEYEQVISYHNKVEKYVPEEFLTEFYYIVGKSYFHLDHYQKAYDQLSKYMSRAKEPTNQLNNTLLISMSCLKQLSNEELFRETLERFEQQFPNDTQLPKAYFMHAMLLKDNGEYAQALDRLTSLKQLSAPFEDEESYQFEYCHLSYELHHYAESLEGFRSYLTNFENSTRKESAWQLFLSSATHLYQEAKEDSSHPYTKERFFADLHVSIMQPHILEGKELKEYQLLYAKMAYEVGKPKDALQYLHNYILSHFDEVEDRKHLAEAHFIAALCHKQTQGDMESFCTHMNQALTLHPEEYNNATVHLQLFNAYISLSGIIGNPRHSLSEEQSQELQNRAAEHLYQARSLSKEPIKEENQLWLADHYFQKGIDPKQNLEEYGISQKEMLARAEKLYKEILIDPKTKHLIPIEGARASYESEVFKLAKLYEQRGAFKKKITLMEQLLEQHTANPQVKWEYKPEAIYELANAYYATNKFDQALETFLFIQNAKNDYPATISQPAQLAIARIRYKQLASNRKKEDSPDVIAILNDLKELQIRKSPITEPSHLEAALTYAEIRADLSGKKNYDTRYNFFLNRVKEHFTSQEDVMTKKYLSKLQELPMQKHIYETYMKFIEGELLRLSAKEAKEQNQLKEMEELNERALTLYDEVLSEKEGTKYLRDKVQESINDINGINRF